MAAGIVPEDFRTFAAADDLNDAALLGLRFDPRSELRVAAIAGHHLLEDAVRGHPNARGRPIVPDHQTDGARLHRDRLAVLGVRDVRGARRVRFPLRPTARS